ncbi:uncharacterized protein BKCO1_3400047 [Diplodia corticola]|uniref:Uncharacterized protein n=1 Tax=Diplodia corticola TaxID=236234 RepID=A0A1J9QXE3_9PEZI|nr:uncharacterized protein BKCO1_3400047 [Diplodia corticola]OJD33064.1 uncharacterized protein BKCO1_3400047 [Diplodia corticola]
MASVQFHSNYVRVNTDPAVISVNLGFADTEKLDANSTTPNPVSGKSEQVVVTYRKNDPPPRTFEVSTQMNFPANGTITVTGGGADANVVEATDGVGNKGKWTVVGH